MSAITIYPSDGQGYGIRGDNAGTAEFAQGLWWLRNTTAIFICPAATDFSKTLHTLEDWGMLCIGLSP